MMHASTDWFRRRHIGQCVIAAIACLSCVDDDPGGVCATDELHVPGMSFYLGGNHVEDFCMSSYDLAVAHAEWVASEWGAEPTTIEYALMDSREEPCWPCRPDSAGCGKVGWVGTTRLPDRHEIAHAAHGTLCSSFLEEGWATLYGDHYDDREVAGTLQEAMDLVQINGRLAGKHYPLAAQFVAFIIDVYGMEKLRELCSLPFKSADEFDSVLSTALQKNFDEIQLEFDEYPSSALGFLRQDQACESFEPGDVPLAPASWSLALGCNANGVEGKIAKVIGNQSLVELSEPGMFGTHRFEFEVDRELALTVELRSCERQGMASVWYTQHTVNATPDTPGTVLILGPPGVYVVRVRVEGAQAVDPSLSIGVSAAPWP